MGSDNAKDLQAELILPPEGAYFTPEALDRWATDTNGTPLPPEAKEELNYLDATEEGYLTCVNTDCCWDLVLTLIVCSNGQLQRVPANISTSDGK